MAAVKHPCARCGKRDIADRMVYSRFTQSRYCIGVARKSRAGAAA